MPRATQKRDHVAGGNDLAWCSHAFGIGGSTKRSIGRRVMGSTLKKIFERARATAEKP